MEDELFVQAGNQGRTMEDAVLREVSGTGALNRHPLSKEGSTPNPSMTFFFVALNLGFHSPLLLDLDILSDTVHDVMSGA